MCVAAALHYIPHNSASWRIQGVSNPPLDHIGQLAHGSESLAHLGHVRLLLPVTLALLTLTSSLAGSIAALAIPGMSDMVSYVCLHECMDTYMV